MKTVFSNSMVAHVWAQQTQKEGQNGTKTFYFENLNTIYSYGSHFPIARFLDANTVLFTTKNYSLTTSQHKYAVLMALPDYINVIHVPYVDQELNHEGNLKYYRSEVERLEKSAGKALYHFYQYMANIQATVKMARKYCRHFKIPCNVVRLPENHSTFAKAKLRADLVQEQTQARKKRNMERNRIIFRGEIKAWKTGHWRLNAAYSFPVMLRINRTAIHKKQGDEIETSHGAIIPVDQQVLQLWKVVSHCKVNKKSWVANGTQLKLGQFSLTTIDKRGTVVAGCHNVGYGEIKSIARQLNFI